MQDGRPYGVAPGGGTLVSKTRSIDLAPDGGKR